MSRADRRWRPSDDDRDRYASAISQAFAEGRIDATDMESRTALVYEATSIADLDALVEDMPAPPRDEPVPARVPRRKPAGAAVATLIGGLAVVLILGAILLSTFRDDGPSVPDPAPAAPPVVAEEPPPPDEEVPPPVDDVELPPIATVQLGLFTLDGLKQLWTAAVAADTEPSAMSLFADSATLEVRSASAHRALDRVEYQGGLLLSREPYRDLGDGETDDDTFFAWTDVTPEAVAAAIAGTPAAMDVAEVAVQHISIGPYRDGQFTISVYPEGDSGINYVRWDATGQRVVAVY
ncbi:DUF1707 SHOCT-like domain-containing protein [Jiangella muralis]|uniref:DUF1707 SHOCT-like domain-containing protein n=1 Tax=Jiangella muralis TaxID=702383 RepID=UPI00069F1F6B|nr:DUF1707 domain-containing protein [Jiangella muralis]